MDQWNHKILIHQASRQMPRTKENQSNHSCWKKQIYRFSHCQELQRPVYSSLRHRQDWTQEDLHCLSQKTRSFLYFPSSRKKKKKKLSLQSSLVCCSTNKTRGFPRFITCRKIKIKLKVLKLLFPRKNYLNSLVRIGHLC